MSTDMFSQEEFPFMRSGKISITSETPDIKDAPIGLFPKFEQVGQDHKMLKEKGYAIHLMIQKNVSYQIKNDKPIESVTLSRAKYDAYEMWLKKWGFQTEDNWMLPLSCSGFEIMRATDARMDDITINYHGIEHSSVNLKRLEENLEKYKIKDNKNLDKMVDDVFKGFKMKGK